MALISFVIVGADRKADPNILLFGRPFDLLNADYLKTLKFRCMVFPWSSIFLSRQFIRPCCPFLGGGAQGGWVHLYLMPDTFLESS